MRKVIVRDRTKRQAGTQVQRRQRRWLNATLTLIIINVIFFFVVAIVGRVYPDFFNEIALNPNFILEGAKLWTIITSMFMHAGFFHLFVNMLSLFFLGSFLERVVGKKRFVYIYLISGVVGALFFVFLFALFQDPRLIILSLFTRGVTKAQIVAVGASAAIFGVAGMLAALTPRLPVYIMFIPIAIPMAVAVILLLVVLSLVPGVANSAHIGGFVAGLAYGLYLRQKHRRKVKLLDRYVRMMR